MTSRIHRWKLTLLHSCLALPKVSYALHTCPPCSITHALQMFDGSIQESLSDRAGSPLSDFLLLWVVWVSCAWALQHVPATFTGSFHHSSSLMAEILGQIPDTSTHLPSAQSALAEAAGKPARLVLHPGHCCFPPSTLSLPCYWWGILSLGGRSSSHSDGTLSSNCNGGTYVG